MGAKATFAINAVFYIPLFFAFFAWKRRHIPSRLPPERLDRAMISGARYALHSPSVRTVLTRAFLFGLAGASSWALAPLVAKDLLHGNAAVFGILLGATGIGAVLGALFVNNIRNHISTEVAVRIFAVIAGLTFLVIGVSHSLWITCLAFFIAGAANILTVALLNVSIQMSAPRWVTARALSLYSSALTGGLGIGAWMWGELAGWYDIGFAFIASGLALAATAVLGLIMPISRDPETDNTAVDIGAEPEVGMALTLRSGPVVIEVEYDVDPDRARDFYAVIVKMQRVRKRIGGFDWSISRDIANPSIWVERYHCPTWGDYLRMRDRYTTTEFDLQAEANAFNRSGHSRRVSRRLVRPFGSVRWKAESPDPYKGTVGYIGP